MKNTFIVKKNNQLLSFYYGNDKAIYMQKIDGNKVYKIKIIENVLEYFSVSLDKKGKIYILCQDENGNVKLATSFEETFKISNLFIKDFNIPERAVFNPLFLGKNTSLLFNSYTNERKTNYISIKTLVQGHEWTDTEHIDIFSLSNNNLFELQRINEKDAIVVYEKREKDIQLGYKEIFNGKISPFIVFHRTGNQIVDYSFLAVGNVIHFLYIVKSLFSNQVIYRKKDQHGLSVPIILYEGQKVKDCSIAFINDTLYCMYMVNFNLFYYSSNDFGTTFSTVSKYKKSFSENIVKVDFVTNITNKFYLNKVYIDYKNPLNIQFLPEIYPEFFSLNIKPSKTNKFYYNTNEENLSSEFISDLSNQNLNPTNTNVSENDLKEQNNFEHKHLDFEGNHFSNKNYKTVMSESSFMDQFDPRLFESIMQNHYKSFNGNAKNQYVGNFANNSTKKDMYTPNNTSISNSTNLYTNNANVSNFDKISNNLSVPIDTNLLNIPNKPNSENIINISEELNVTKDIELADLTNSQNSNINPDIQKSKSHVTPKKTPSLQINMDPNFSMKEKDSIDFIKNKLEIANEQLEKQSNQLIKLNNMIQEKNKENLEIELELKKQIKELEQENKKLKEENTGKSTNKEDKNEKNAGKIEEDKENKKE